MNHSGPKYPQRLLKLRLKNNVSQMGQIPTTGWTFYPFLKPYKLENAQNTKTLMGIVMTLQWEVDWKYIEVLEDGRETTLITRRQLENCIGSSKYRFCQFKVRFCHGSRHWRRPVFLSQPLLDTSNESGCYEAGTMPTMEQTISLGYGVWLILSAMAEYALTETYMNPSTSTHSYKFLGCRIWKANHKAKHQDPCWPPELQPCTATDHVSRPPRTLGHCSQYSSLDDLLLFIPKTQANVALARSITDDIKYVSPATAKHDDSLLNIAVPIALKMTQMRNSFWREFSSFTNLSTTLLLVLICFIVSMMLQILSTFFTFILRRCPAFFLPLIKQKTLKQKSNFDPSDHHWCKLH